MNRNIEKGISVTKQLERSRSAGLTLIEILVATVIFASIVALSYSMLGGMHGSVNKALISASTETELNQLVQHFVKMGRLGSNCLKVTPTNPLAIGLQCELKTGTVTTLLRYIKPVPLDPLNPLSAESQIRFEHWNGSVWELRQAYGGTGNYLVTRFDLCSTMNLGSCPIEPVEMSMYYQSAVFANLPANLNNRFYRFQIVANEGAAKAEYKIQSAIFVRNPAPNGVTYINSDY